MFNSEGDSLGAELQPDNGHSADGWEESWVPETELQQQNGEEVAFRVDVLFAKPETYEAREECDVKQAIRLQAKNNLEWDIQEVFTPPLRRPGHRPAVLYKGFSNKG